MQSADYLDNSRPGSTHKAFLELLEQLDRYYLLVHNGQKQDDIAWQILEHMFYVVVRMPKSVRQQYLKKFPEIEKEVYPRGK